MQILIIAVMVTSVEIMVLAVTLAMMMNVVKITYLVKVSINNFSHHDLLLTFGFYDLVCDDNTAD